MSAAALCALWSGSARAVDPAVPWMTIETPHFRIHAHEGPHMRELAERVARTAEAAHDLLVPRLGHAPSQKTDVLVTDDVDSANGSASVLLSPVITLLAEPPEDLSVLGDYDDYLWIVIVHEYTHILHLDNAGGLPDLVNLLFGRLYLPNLASPRWLVEGLATFQESNLSSAGRNRSALFDMWMRESMLSRPFRLDELSHFPTRWPRGHLAYLYGGRFLAYVARRVGEPALISFLTHYGKRPIPYALNTTAEASLGVSFERLYDDWLVEQIALAKRARSAVVDAGETLPTLVSAPGEATGQPVFTEDGARIFYLEAGDADAPAIRSVASSGGTPRTELRLPGAVSFTLSPDATRVVYSLKDVHRQFQVYDDLYETTLGSGATRRLTVGLRATEPSYSPDGRSVVFVGRCGGGCTYLGRLTLAGGSVERLLEASPDERIFTPRVSPDGRRVLFAQAARGGLAVRELQLSPGPRSLRELVAPTAMNIHPRYAGDARILFSSDRSGVYNTYALELGAADARPEALTNVTSGVFHPAVSSDGARLAFAYYTPEGLSIGVLPRAGFHSKPLAAARSDRPPIVYRDEPTQRHPARPYQPLDSLRPRYWLPLGGVDARGLFVGASTSGSDLVGRLGYDLSATVDLQRGSPAGAASVRALVGYPTFSLSGATVVTQPAFTRPGTLERQWVGAASATLPFSRVDASYSLTASVTYRRFETAPLSDVAPDEHAPRFPLRGQTLGAALGASFSNARGYAGSVSAEEGNVVSLSLTSSGPDSFGAFASSSAIATYQGYLKSPFTRHHVLAGRVTVGVAVGDLGGRPAFSIGGTGIVDPLLELLRGPTRGPGSLRGYPAGFLVGNALTLVTLEYRAPLVDVDRGISLLPVYLRRVHGSVHGDAGAVAARLDRLRRVYPSAGLTVVGELTLGYALPLELRLSLTRGFAAGGVTQLSLGFGSGF